MANPWERDWSAPAAVPGKKPWERDWSVAQPQTSLVAQKAPSQTDYRGEGGGRGSTLESLLVGARQGVTFGAGDEINAAVRAAGDWIGNPLKIGDGQDFDPAYDKRLKHERGLLQQTGEENPVASTIGEIGGAVLPALTYGVPAMAGRGLIGMMGTGAAIGATEGAVYGFNSGEGGVMPRVGDAAKTAALGGVLGMAAPVAVAGMRQAYLGGRDLVTGGIDAAIDKGSQSRANRAIAKTVKRSGSSVADVTRALREALADGQDAYLIGDALGVSGQRRLSGIARSGGEASSDIVAALNQRQLDQSDRIAGYVRDTFGFNGQGSQPGTEGHVFRDAPADVLRRAQPSAAAAEGALKTARGDAADVAYRAARATAKPVDVRGPLEIINQRLEPLEGSGIAGDGIDSKLAQFRARLAAPKSALKPDETARELADFDRVLGVKQDLQDVIEAAQRRGEGNAVRELKKLEKALDLALEQSSDGYRVANDQFREASRVIDAVRAGSDMAAPGTRAVDNTSAFQGMTSVQQQAARLGYGDKALAKVEAAAGPGTNRARQFTSSKARQEAAALAKDPAKFGRQIDRENVMFETRNRTSGGSRTADNLEDISDLRGMDPSIIPQAMTAPIQAIISVLSRSGSTLTGMGPGTRKLVADALMSRDTGALQAAMAQAKTTQERGALAQSLIRLSAISTGGAGLVERNSGPR